MNALDGFSPATRAWFEASFPSPTPAQDQGWPAIGSGDHTLIHAPTGSGKTLAAFLWTIDRLLGEPLPDRSERCRVLYVSPLKALAYDIERNLRAPLVGIRHAAERLGTDPLPELTTFLRTGDTPPDERRRMLRNPPDILITTPESLYLLLTSQARSALATVRWVIVDEVHAVAGTKRGAHLALSLERLEEVAPRAQRIGLSATQRPLETTARFLGGGEFDGTVRRDRAVTIVDVGEDRAIEVELVVPVADMEAPAPPDPLEPDVTRAQSIWPSIHPRILGLIEDHTSTIVFANSRRLAERISAEINELAGREVARAHHGSVSREQRVMIEESLKRGELKAVVATSSLELGIDMGAVDLVIQVEAPVSVASGLQRVGRAGHQVGETSRAKLFPKYRGDLLVASAVAEEMRQGNVEPTRIPRNPLDVLAQQLVASVVNENRTSTELFEMVRRAAPYESLPRSAFDATLDMLAGRYPSDLFSDLRPRVTWDRVDDAVSARPGARQLAVTNPGTIPDRGLYRVVLPDGSRVGELDEEMVYESRQGDVFVLGASTWRVTEIGVDRVVVTPAPGEPAKMPFWHGDMAGRSLATGRAIGRFTREIAALSSETARQRLVDVYHLDEWAADNLIAYLDEERESAGAIPDDETIVVQRFRDEIGDWRVVILSPLGARIHAPWAMALTERLRSTHGFEVDVIWSDDGIAIRFPDADEIPGVAELMLEPEDVEPLLMEGLADSALFAARFREASGRSLLLPRRRPGSRTPLWLQRRRAAGLLSVARQFGTFPIVLETYREILQDDFDVPALMEVLQDVRSRKIRTVEAEVPSASPFASSLLFAFVAAYLYEADTPLAERRAAALTLDRELLAELLGEGELRELLSVDVITTIELELQHLTDSRAARSSEAVTDLLRDLGPLTREEVSERSRGFDVDEVLDDLHARRRIIPIQVGGETTWAAIEDAGRLRDALGAQPPPGVPHVFLEPVADPLGDVIGRYARTHAPFAGEEASRRLHLPPSVVEEVLERLEKDQRVVRGSFTAGVTGSEWVDAEVLRRIKRRSLAELRGEIEPVDHPAVGRFLPAWHGVNRQKRGRAACLEIVLRLQGAEMPASTLEGDVLPSRLEDAGVVLDQLMVEGEVVWVGRGSLGPRDGRIALYQRSQLASLHFPSAADPPTGDIVDSVREHLADRGASFFSDLYAAAGGGDPDQVIEALWDLVWAGEVTNDTLAPVRAFIARRRRGGRPRNLSSSFPPHTAGRWSLVADLLESRVPDTERATAWANQLLDRHGIVTRTVVSSEGIPGGFSGIYPVLARMEETGRIRRGYFIEGQGGAQFASPGAVDRVRGGEASGVMVLAATDPANPYGSSLPWPAAPVRLARSAGTYVVLVDGALAGYVERGGKAVTIWDETAPDRAPVADALATIAGRHGRFTIETLNGVPVASSPLHETLVQRGFAPSARGLAWRGPRTR